MEKLTFRTSWSRKSVVGGEYPFAVEYEPHASKEYSAPVISVSGPEFKRIAETLDSFTPRIQKIIEAHNLDVFVVKSGIRMLAVDPQGYDYPRYKGAVIVGGKMIGLEVPRTTKAEADKRSSAYITKMQDAHKARRKRRGGKKTRQGRSKRSGATAVGLKSIR